VVTAGKTTAGVLAKMGRLEAALMEYWEAARRAEQAIAAVPADPRNREILGEVEMGIGLVEGKIGGRDHQRNSCDAYRRAAEVFEDLVNKGIATPEDRAFAKDAAHFATACALTTPSASSTP
jgi:hypothetical protein